jgi:hypothetical protein
VAATALLALRALTTLRNLTIQILAPPALMQAAAMA